MPKNEYEFYVKHHETRRVFVEADSEEEAKELAEDKYYNGETEFYSQYTEVELNWSSEED